MNAVYIAMGIVLPLWILGYVSRRHKNRHKIVCVVESNCTGCGRCVKRCSHNVLETVKDETGIHVAVKYPDRCTACEDCLGRCKFNALKLIERR
ncbi:MAG: 4Fe-4S dicluster domain-containing protein [Tannerella sp.]|nr:4Fe-4S dicluster domain-containing protein [Tannerella sp.]